MTSCKNGGRLVGFGDSRSNSTRCSFTPFWRLSNGISRYFFGWSVNLKSERIWKLLSWYQTWIKIVLNEASPDQYGNHTSKLWSNQWTDVKWILQPFSTVNWVNVISAQSSSYFGFVLEYFCVQSYQGYQFNISYINADFIYKFCYIIDNYRRYVELLVMTTMRVKNVKQCKVHTKICIAIFDVAKLCPFDIQFL